MYGMRCIGKGLEAAKTLCAVLDLPPPPAIFQNYSSMLNRAIKEISTASMMNAAKETVEINGSTDIAVAVDGPWQRRGHTSLSGVVTATSVATGKVIDVECLTKYCSKCKLKVGAHICHANYAGPSGGMEAKGAVDIFCRSEHARSARYVEFLGDGDSKAHLAVNEAKPYGDIKIEKAECIGHIQKRMGARLRRLVNEWKGKKISDGKALSGKGRLTGTEIDNIQRYYGLAIRNNCHDLSSMRKAVWATYFHKLSTDETPQHGLCPAGADSWCRYRRAEVSGEVYEHKHSLPETVMNLMKPIFRDLSDENLLRKCLHGRTQNANESFNNLIWTRVPKTVFVGLDTLKIGVRDAVLSFNEGAISRVNVLENIDVGCGRNMRTALLKIDKQRVQKAEVEASNITKEARVKKRNEKRKREEETEEGQNHYAPGMF